MKSIKNWLIKKLGGYTSDDFIYISTELECDDSDEVGYYKWQIGDKLGEIIIDSNLATIIQTYPGLVGILRVVNPRGYLLDKISKS